MHRLRLVIWLLGVSLILVWTVAGERSTRANVCQTPMVAADAATWKSLLTPEDFQGILKLQIDDLSDGTKSAGKFRLGYRKVERAAVVVAILGNIGSLLFDGEDAVRASMLRVKGLELAKAAGEKQFDVCQPLVAEIAKYPEGFEPTSDVETAPWGDFVSLDLVMKNVSSIDSEARKSVKMSDAEYKKSAASLAFQSKLLACLAVIAREHDTAEDWQGWCDEMRESSMEMAAGFGKRSQDASSKSHQTLQRSCTECHKVYQEGET